jgi:hypothetical protein
MLRPRFRTSIRTLMIAVALSGVAVWIIPLIAQFGSIILYVGNGDLSIRILVLDSVSKEPVSNAYIFQNDFDYPEKGLYNKVCTDQSGHATIVESRLINGSIDNFGRDSAFVYYPTWGIQVCREGYKTIEYISLQDRIGRGGDPSKGALQPPVIVVEIERVEQARTGHSTIVKQQ